jgi:CBS domain-containing protein
MKVKDIMTPQPINCSRGTNLAEAGALMLEADCGILPVLDDGRRASRIPCLRRRSPPDSRRRGFRSSE